MHDCRKLKDRIIDLVFDELDSNEKPRVTAELNDCEGCRDLYRSMSETLTVFDKAAEAGMPEETYWPGYGQRLRAKLTEEIRPTLWQGLLAGLAKLNPLPRLPLPASIGLALLILAAGLWLALPRSNDQQQQIAPVIVKNPEVKPEQKPDQIEEHVVKPQVADKTPKVESGDTNSNRRTTPKPQRDTVRVAADEKRERAIEPKGDLAAKRPRRMDPSLLLQVETASHIEKAQMLLRAFRNARLSEDADALDLSYEKQMSRELLSKNRLLRRSSKGNRDLRAEELLNGVEPLLLDIANLPDSPSIEDVRWIKDLIRKQEIIAEMQFYSARASRKVF